MKDSMTFLDAYLAWAILATIHYLKHNKAEMRREARDVMKQGLRLA